MMFGKFLALPLVARRALTAGTLFFVACVAARLPDTPLCNWIFGLSLVGSFWASGVMVPAINVALYVFKVALKVKASTW
ncbi:hypothetical protein [Caballeronia sp. GAWG2-1]|uniref:hypothetical protein n=1 Tax=Caballeronia sp. GAWG2-1 TaxID=2921744 RepID=UPI002027DFC8|nr:hypothetical protein [Caballeronia sp. GAWG2-1]